MSTLTEGAVFDALRTVQEPELGRDIVTLNMVKGITIDGPQVAFTIELTTPACPLKDEIERTPGRRSPGSAPPTSRSPGAPWSAAPRRRRARSSSTA